MAKESGVLTISEQHQLPRGHLLSLPSELLVEEILSLLLLPSLIACSRTCKSLHNLISSSLLLTYLKELNIAGLLDNPLCTYTSYPLEKRLSRLRERERRWLLFHPRWKRQLPMIHLQHRYHTYDIVSGHLLFKITKSGVEGAITSLRLPDKAESQAVWEEAADVGQFILEFGMASEEHDLIACLTCAGFNNPVNFQVHLIAHSTADHHPSACMPIIDVPTPPLNPLPGAAPFAMIWGDVVVCGENLAVSVKYPTSPDPTFAGGLYIWNWMSGVLKARFPLERSVDSICHVPGMTFLRDDMLLVPNAVVNSLDVYHIPCSPLVVGSSVRMVSRFNLPGLAENVAYSYIESHLRPPLRSSSVTGIPHDKPFVINPERTILGFEFHLVNHSRGTWVKFFLLIRWQYLLARCLESFSELLPNPTLSPRVDGSTITYPWHDWGPRNSRLFPISNHLTFNTSTTGSRWVTVARHADDPDAASINRSPHSRTVELYDFDETRIRIAAQRVVTVKHRGRSIRMLPLRPENGDTTGSDDDTYAGTDPQPYVELVDATSPSVYPNSDHLFAEKVSTCLPYLRTTYIQPRGLRRPFKEKKQQFTKWMKTKFRPGGRRESSSRGEGDEDPSSPPHFGISCEWDGILADDERIIGITSDSSGGVGRYKGLDTLYFS